MNMKGSGHTFIEVYPRISLQELGKNMKKFGQDIRYLAEIKSMVVSNV
jgi:hypothetical protein